MIENLELKLKGNIPVTREELCKLISSWGRSESLLKENNIFINDCVRQNGYPLENLDVSQIEDFSEIFCYSYYNGNLSKWDVSNCKNMFGMFYKSEFNNNSLSYWNTSNVENMNFIFYKSNFNGNISNWNILNVKTMKNSFDSCPFDGDISKWKFNNDVYCKEIFCDNENFYDKYNNCKPIPNDTYDFLKWFEEKREKIKNINQGSKKEVLDFFSFNNDIEKGLL